MRCIVPDCRCRDGSVAAHVRVNTDSGMGTKPSDEWTVPLCDGHHKEQHQIGHRAFDEKYGIDMRETAKDLASLSPVLNPARARTILEHVL